MLIAIIGQRRADSAACSGVKKNFEPYINEAKTKRQGKFPAKPLGNISVVQRMSPVILVAIVFQLIAVRISEIDRVLAAPTVDLDAMRFETFLGVLEAGGGYLKADML